MNLIPLDRFAQADATRLPFDDGAFDITVGSPPYCDARTYGIGAQRGCAEWVNWMVDVTLESQRVTKGPVIWVAAGVTRQRNYWPACEGLMWEWWKRGGNCQLYRPCFWHRVGIPGSGGDDWFRADVEYVMCFKRPGKLPWSNNTADGHPPKWAPGGEMSNRLSDGARVNQWGPVGGPGGMGAKKADGSLRSRERPSHRKSLGFEEGYVRSRPGRGRFEVEAGKSETTGEPIVRKSHTKRSADGSMQDQSYSVPVLANPGTLAEMEFTEEESDLIKIIVGGGALGHPLAHENEAPYPEALAARFIKSLCPPKGKVLDPFSGSGTTTAVAWKLGRFGVGCDLRFNQCQLGRRRLATPNAVHKSKKKTPEDKQPRLFEDAAA